MDDILVSVIIVTWERKDDVLAAVQSVYDQAYQNTEVIVVDNASTDNTGEALRKAFPAVRLITLDRNMGAAAGRNPGILAAKGEIIFLMDSDATLGHDSLSKIVNRFNNAPDIGALTCKILSPITKELDHNSWIFTEKNKVDQDVEFLSFSINEGGVAIRKEVFDQVGLFSEFLFFGREGEELSLRILDAGYQIYYFPQAFVYHRGSQRKRVPGSQDEYYNLRNCLYIYYIRYPWWMLAGFVPLKIGTSIIRGIKKGYLRKVLEALHDFYRELPELKEKRHPVSNATAYTYFKLLRKHGSLAWDLQSWIKHQI